MGDEDRLAVTGKEHEIGFPMARLLAVTGALRTFLQGSALLDDIDHAAALPHEPAPAVLGAGQQAMPVILLRRAVIDEAID